MMLHARSIDVIKRALEDEYHHPGDTPEIAMQQVMADIRYLLDRYQSTWAVLEELDEAVREGLEAWPQIMNRTEFVRWCVAERVSQATSALTAEIDQWKAAGDNLAQKLTQTEWDLKKATTALAGMVSDEEATVALDIYRRQDGLNDPYAFHRAIEDLLQARRQTL